MKIISLIVLMASIMSCNNVNDKNKIPDKNDRASIEKNIVGIWELIKRNYGPSEEPKLIDHRYQEYLEIKPDGTCQDERSIGKWFLSYSNDFVMDSTSKVFFTEMFNLEPSTYGGYDRSVKPYQIKVSTENGTKYLYLTSLVTSATKIYLRKN